MNGPIDISVEYITFIYIYLELPLGVVLDVCYESGLLILGHGRLI